MQPVPQRPWTASRAADTNWSTRTRHPSYFKDAEARNKMTDLTYSLGMIASADGRLIDVAWEGPVYKAGLTVGCQIIAVNGIAFDADRLKTSIKDASKGRSRHRTFDQEWRSLPHGNDRLPRRASLSSLGTRGQHACKSGSDLRTAKLTLSHKLVERRPVSRSFALWFLGDLIVPESDALRISTALIYVQHMKSHS